MNKNQLLQKYNLKSTPQRLEIIDLLLKNGHCSIDSLYHSLKIKFPSISLSTIYKNINTMRDKCFLSEVKISGQKNAYELIKDEHSHVVCIKCHQILDIQVNVSELLNQAKEASHYKLNESSVVFHGICSKCE